MENPPHLTTALVLLVDDDQSRRLRDAHALLDEGYEVVESESIVEAMHFLERRGDFDAMVVDMGAPHSLAGVALVEYALRRSGVANILVCNADDIELDAWRSAGGRPATIGRDGDLVVRMRNLLALAPKPPAH